MSDVLNIKDTKVCLQHSKNKNEAFKFDFKKTNKKKLKIVWMQIIDHTCTLGNEMIFSNNYCTEKLATLNSTAYA